MTKVISLIEKHTTARGFDLNAFTGDLASMCCRDQKRTAEAIIPRDYAVTETYESTIIDNVDLLEAYYRTYIEKSKHAPERCKESLHQDLGQKFAEMMERHNG